jgi:hypothetical protein
MELAKVLPPGQPAPISFRLTSLAYRLRILVYTACLATVISAGVGLVFVASKIITRVSVPTEARSEAVEDVATKEVVAAVVTIGSEAAVQKNKVWLAETGSGYELYSNGARVLTEFETSGPERVFCRLRLEELLKGSAVCEQMQKPVGIVYHMSEGDLLPFADRFNSSLIHQARSLLVYSRERQLYNYVIDRFGRTYRIVRDEHVANHAGNSVWSDGPGLYVNLSTSFIGVCIEGKSMSEKGPSRINEAQIYAARVLTSVLRSKYEIDDANCVTHGLVSVNPSNRLMGYHTDWVAGFPFEAIGLSNKYETELIAVSRLGFSFDQAYIRAAGGKKWSGLNKAEQVRAEIAQRNSTSPEEQRRLDWSAFQQAYSTEKGLSGTRAAVDR